MARRLLLAAAAALSWHSAHAVDPFACNPLTDPSISCMLPWPDNFFLSTTWNASAPRYLTMTNETFPVDNSGYVIDPVAGGWTQLQGFTAQPMMAYFAGLNLDFSALPRYWNISSSVTGAPGGRANSLLLNVETGAAEEHWVELDHASDTDGNPDYERALLIWPSRRLNASSTYIVAFRGLLDDFGVPIAPSDGFAALKYGKATDNPALEASRARFKDIFSTLSAAGWAQDELVLAWSFTTNTIEDVTSSMIAMRDDATARVTAPDGSVNISYVIDKITDFPRDNIARQIEGRFSVPHYLSTVLPLPGSHLVRDPVTGLPQYQGLAQFRFTVAIPYSVAGTNATGAPRSGVYLQYGHGLFGDQSEVETGYLGDEANRYGYVLGACDEIGLTEFDEPAAIVILTTNITQFSYVPDRSHQGVLNELLMTKFVTRSAFRTDPAMTFSGIPALAADSKAFYNGNSQGGLMGHAVIATSQDITRAVLGVGAGMYSLLLPRSSDFSTLFDVLRLRYERSVDRISIMAVLQALWDRLDPSGYVRHITEIPLPNTPAHTVLFQHGLSDAQVSWLGIRYSARSANAVTWESTVVEGNETLDYFPRIPDTTVITEPGTNVMTTWYFNTPPVPSVNVPPSDQWDTHEMTRRQATSQAQMAAFFLNGTVTNTCGGPCVAPFGG